MEAVAATTQHSLIVRRPLPHTGFWGLFHGVGTRCSESSQHAQGDDCCPHRYTGASASASHRPVLQHNKQAHQTLDLITLLLHYLILVTCACDFFFKVRQIDCIKKKKKKNFAPVVKRSWTSAGLDNVREGMRLAGCEGGREVEAGEDRVLIRGWWGQTTVGTLRVSIWTPGPSISCRCGLGKMTECNTLICCSTKL